jgi:hypothetical protein
MSGDQPMRCPECGEDAVHQPPSDLVPWEAHGLARAEWSHRDGTRLCPVIGPAGYQPAQPQPAPSQPGTAATRPEPAEVARPAGRVDLDRAVGPGTVGRAYMVRMIDRLGDLHRQAAAEPHPEPEPEAGA